MFYGKGRKDDNLAHHIQSQRQQLLTPPPLLQQPPLRYDILGKILPPPAFPERCPSQLLGASDGLVRGKDAPGNFKPFLNEPSADRKEEHVGPEHYYNIKFYNITCHGPKAQSHIYNEDPDILCCVESHMPYVYTPDLRAQLSVRNMRVFNNPARPSKHTASGTHGGEYIARKRYYNITAIEDDVYKLTQEYSHEPISFSAWILRLQRLTVVLVGLYLWSGKGMSEDNFRIFKQLRFLRDLLHKPLLVLVT